jgi:hypothetical protein
MVTKPSATDETPLMRYLVGRMDPQEQERIEQRYLSDPEFHEELRATERDLIDQYVHGELADAEAFERNFLSSPQRRQRVEFARALMQSLETGSVRADGEARDRERWWPPALFTSSWAWQFAAASVVILVGGWLVLNWEGQPPAEQIAEAPRQPTQPSAQPAPSNESPHPAPPSPPGAAPIPIATFVLVPTLTRDSDQTPTLAIARDRDVRFQLSLEPGDYESYRVVVQTAESEEIWRQDGLKIVRTSSGDAIIVTLPGARFSDRDYIVRIGGVSVRGDVENAASYYFRARTR